MNNDTKTPRTDAEATLSCDSSLRSAYVVHVEFARELEREIERLTAERDEVRESYCLLMEAYRGGDGRVTANKLGWGYLFEEDKPCQ